MKKIILAILIILPACADAQVRLTVKSSDTLDFVLLINDVRVNNMPCLSITLDNIPSTKTTLAANFPAHPELNFTQAMVFKKNVSVFYEIETQKGALKFVLKSESTMVLPEKKTQVLQPVPQNIMPADSLASDSLQLADDTKGCSNPVAKEEFDRFTSEINGIRPETKRLQLMKTFVSQNCIRVEQLRLLMSTLALENQKIELLESAMDHIYDLEDLEDVEGDFFMEKSKTRVHSLISSKTP